MRFMSSMTREEIMEHLHHGCVAPPPVRPCDTPNSSDKKTSWSAEELHKVTGCRKFKDYRKLLSITRDGRYMDVGEFPESLGTYATIPKSHRGKGIDRTHYRYLEKVHGDIGFGDTVAIGGAHYALVFVDRATRFQMGVLAEVAGKG